MVFFAFQVGYICTIHSFYTHYCVFHCSFVFTHLIDGFYFVVSPPQVVYVPSTMEHIEQEVALQRERQIRLHGIQMDMELNLPPSVQISEDGEEGYLRSQRHLKLSCDKNVFRRESIRPPPNKIVCQGDSPPAYRSNSVSKLEGHYYGGGKRGAAVGSHLNPASIMSGKLGCGGSNSPSIARCHSMSGDKRLQSYAHHHGASPGAASCGHTAAAASRCHHGFHGSQLACSHPSHSAHSYGWSPPGGTPGGTTQTLSSAPSAKALKSRISSHLVSHPRTDASSHSNTNSACPGGVVTAPGTTHCGPPHPQYRQVVTADSASSGPTPTGSQKPQSDSKVW